MISLKLGWGGGVRIFRAEQAFFGLHACAFALPGGTPLRLRFCALIRGLLFVLLPSSTRSPSVSRSYICAPSILSQSCINIYMQHGGKPGQDRQNRLYVKHKLQYDSLKPPLALGGAYSYTL
jgi:hypothetical protein